MAEEVEKTENAGEQMDLIDVHPENEKEILEAVKVYKKYQSQRLKFLDKEVAQKKKVLELVHAADLQRLSDGRIRFRCDNFIITVTPSDEKIKIKDEDE
jgi:hypothetical protein